MPERLNNYFAAEALEYLGQLDHLVGAPGAPDTRQLLRLSTGVRGSVQMAGAEQVATIAERLEDAVRSVVSSHIPWSEELRALCQETIVDLEVLIGSLSSWGEEEEGRTQKAVLRWDQYGEAADVVGVDSLFYDDAGPHIIDPHRDLMPSTDSARVATADPASSSATHPASSIGLIEESSPERSTDDIVPIDTLFLRGEAALREALALRDEFERLAHGDATGSRPLSDLVEELFDLVELGLSAEPPAG